MSFAALVRRAIAWLRRNPEVRADALELAAHAARGRAIRLEADGRGRAAARARRRAVSLDARAEQLRPAIGMVSK
jgi:hypothetical protein